MIIGYIFKRPHSPTWTALHGMDYSDLELMQREEFDIMKSEIRMKSKLPQCKSEKKTGIHCDLGVEFHPRININNTLRTHFFFNFSLQSAILPI